MTTPYEPIIVQVGNSADQFWPGIPGAPDLLLVNLDDNDNITVGPKSVTPGGPNGYLIQAQSAISLPADSAWSAITDSLDAPLDLQVLAGGGNWSASAIAIAAQIAESGLALAIAQEIATQGLSLVGAPNVLYGGQVSPPPAGANLMGATTNGKAFVPQVTNQQAIPLFDSYTGRAMATAVQKIYYSEDNWTFGGDAPDTATQALAVKAQTLVCFFPLRDPTGNYTGAQYTTSKNNLAAAIAQWKTAYTNIGMPANSFKAEICQEPNDLNKFATNAAGGNTYTAYCNFYAPTVRAAGISLVYNPTGNQTNQGANGYYPGDANVDEVYVDWYGTHKFADGYSLDIAEALADNHLPSPVPFGIGEMNAVLKSSDLPITQAQWFDGTPASYIGDLIQRFTARLAAGKHNGWIIFWLGAHAANVPQNQINSAADFKIAGIDALFDALTPSSALTIPGGGFTSLVPLKPTPGGGFALVKDLSYELEISLEAGVGSTVPFSVLQLHWLNTDEPGAQFLFQERWALPMGPSGSPAVITGSGPQRAQYLLLQIFNQDTVACLVDDVQVNGTSRQEAKHDLRWDAVNSPAIPGYIKPGGGRFFLQLGSINQVIVNSGTTAQYLFSMFAGEVFVRVKCQGAAAANTVNVSFQAQPTSVFGVAYIWQAILGSTVTEVFPPTSIFFPRGPVAVIIGNADANNVQISVQVIAHEV